jgi:prophage DNA circulation protein
MDDLFDASFKGIPFQATSIVGTPGRQLAIHTYPYRDAAVWVEDMGEAVESCSMTGYLHGDDVYTWSAILESVCAEGGEGELIHPSKGTLLVTMISSVFSDRGGGIVEIRFQFLITNGEGQLAPDLEDDTVGACSIDADALDDACAMDYDDTLGTITPGQAFSQMVGTLRSGIAVVMGVVHTVQGYVNKVMSIVHQAQAVIGAVKGIGMLLSGTRSTLGRFDGGNVKSTGLNSVLAPLAVASSVVSRVTGGVNALLHAATAARTLVSNTVNTVENIASFL